MTTNSAHVRALFITCVICCLGAVDAKGATTTKGLFFGGDPEDGLDLTGNFVYAVSVASPVGALPVQDVTFMAEGVEGVTVGATSRVAGWGTVEFGDTANDNNLEQVVNSIGHMYPLPLGPMYVTATGLEPGASYKLQLLFSEACCQRAFDVLINGELVEDEFAPVMEQGGLPQSFIGVVITHEFTAETSELTVELNGTTVTSPEYTDLNPILSGFTLERTSEVVDSDEDGLTDDWEYLHFESLEEDGSGDPDEDGFPNSAEFAAGTNPTLVDSDGDGLPDGEEANTHGTNPANRDSDGDGLWDGEEINMMGTDPNMTDTDEDGVSDFDEQRLLSDPLDDGSVPLRTQIGLFTGGDEGEGLDLQGTFLYALDAGPDVGGIGLIGDAFFLQTIDGVTVTAGSASSTWHNPSFGDSLEDDMLELVMAGIRWSSPGTATPAVVIDFNYLEVGAAYKLQLLFAENGWPRGFDVVVDGAVIVDDFSAPHYQGGYPKTNGVVVTHEFIARAEAMSVVLDGRGVTTPHYTDRNAMFQAATLELVAANEDSDGDGLPDPWEMQMFGDLTHGPDDDSDDDGLSNEEEFGLNLQPGVADSDRDGLSDGDEVNLHGTNPLQRDSDNDGLSDSDEINTHETDPLLADTDGDRLNDSMEISTTLTNPLKADTDDDGTDDYSELRLLTDPLDSNSRPVRTSIGLFTGGDVGEGLDLEGNFTYAVDIGTEFALGMIREANFTDALAEGFTLDAGVSAPNWHVPEYGDSLEDDMLEIAMASISYSVIGQTPDEVTLTFDNLEVGGAYKLQLLFAEACCARGFDISFDGELIADDFSPMVYQGGFDPAVGVVVTHEFTATAGNATVILAGATVTTASLTDRNALIQAATLEHLGEAPAEVTITGVEQTGGGFSITLASTPGETYQLEYRQSLSDGEWIVVGSPVTATGSSVVLEDHELEHVEAAAGFWRVRQD